MLECWLERKLHFSLLLQQTKVYRNLQWLSIVGCSNQLILINLGAFNNYKITFPTSLLHRTHYFPVDWNLLLMTIPLPKPDYYRLRQVVTPDTSSKWRIVDVFAIHHEIRNTTCMPKPADPLFLWVG
jgi:hypothetical protein